MIEQMKMNAHTAALADPGKARKLARDVKKQAELRQRLTAAIEALPPEKMVVGLVVDAVIEELKR